MTDNQVTEWQHPDPDWEITKRLHGKEKSDLFEFEQSVICGEGNLTVGFIVTLKDPRSQIWFDSGYGLRQSFNVAETAIFNQVYPFGGYTGYVRVIDSDKNWQEKKFKVCVDEPQSRIFLTNFSQTKAAGHVAPGATGSGLDVSFSVATTGAEKQIKWDFGDGGSDEGVEASHIYKSARKEPFIGSVNFFQNGLSVENISFNVIMKEFKLRKGTNIPKLFSGPNMSSWVF